MRRHNQQEPLGNWSIWLVMAGRGFGKTRTGSQWIIEKFLHSNNIRIGIIGSSFCHVKNVMLEGPSGILFNSCKNITVQWSNKCLIYKSNKCFFFTDKNYEELRGYSFNYIWIDELCKFQYGLQVVDHAILCLRQGSSKMTITTTPKDLPIFHNLINSKETYITRGSSFDNKNNLSPLFLKNLSKFKGSQLEKQEVYGQLMQCSNKWNTSHFVYKAQTQYDCVVIGIDPAIGAGVTGIIVVGIFQDQFFVLEDFSTSESIIIWGETVAKEYNKYQSKYYNCFVNIEINQGGEILVSMLNMIQPGININCYRASLSKINRRTKLLYLYEKKYIFHSRVLDFLEYEMLNDPKDRVDALVWAVESQCSQVHVWSV